MKKCPNLSRNGRMLLSATITAGFIRLGEFIETCARIVCTLDSWPGWWEAFRGNQVIKCWSWNHLRWVSWIWNTEKCSRHPPNRIGAGWCSNFERDSGQRRSFYVRETRSWQNLSCTKVAFFRYRRPVWNILFKNSFQALDSSLRDFTKPMICMQELTWLLACILPSHQT